MTRNTREQETAMIAGGSGVPRIGRDIYRPKGSLVWCVRFELLLGLVLWCGAPAGYAGATRTRTFLSMEKTIDNQFNLLFGLQ